MEERFEEILSHYDIDVHSMSRVRSGFLLETDGACFLLKMPVGSGWRLEYEERVTKFLLDCGYAETDRPVRNREGFLVTTDPAGDSYLIKEWYHGEECSVRNREAIFRATANLAKLHRHLEKTSLLEAPICNEAFYLEKTMEKRTRELKRIYSYIRSKKQKNEFEIMILNSFSEFFEQAQQALEKLKKFPLEQLLEEVTERKTLVHGSYSYHNLLFTSQGIVTLNFDRGGLGLQMMDLYYFLRKVMEKNEWKRTMGEQLLKEYNKHKVISELQWELLAILLSYPEKYWKILNHYYNNKKSWIAAKDIEKLEDVCQKESKKRMFLKDAFSLSF